jgi:uncharacterized protein YqeY
MEIKNRISSDMKDAMRGREQLKIDTLRMALSAIKNKEIEKKSDLDDADIMTIISTLVKQRKDAVEMYRNGGRDDLADKEETEIGMLKNYLPEQMSEEEVLKVVNDVITDTGAASMADMGKVMQGVMARVAGKTEGKIVNELVKRQLSK